MNIEITDALMLGFERQRQYLEGDVFAKGDTVVMRVEGVIVDLSNVQDSLSGSILNTTKERFDKVLGEALLNQGHIVGNIIVNGTNYGNGRITSVESTSSEDLYESKITLGKYRMTLEFLESLGSTVFEVKGQDYPNVEAVIEPYVHRLLTLGENFSFTKNQDGSEDMVHSINIQYRPSASEDPIDIAKTIAASIFANTSPNYPSNAWVAGGGKSFIFYPLDAARSGVTYEETYDTATGRCSFSKSIRKFGSSEYASGAAISFSVNTFSKKYQISRTEDGFMEISETCEIWDKDNDGDILPSSAIAYLNAQFLLSYAACETKFEEIFRGNPLSTVDGALLSEVGGRYKTLGVERVLSPRVINKSFFTSDVDRRWGYTVTYNDDPNEYGYSIERKYDLQRDESGVIAISSEHVAKFSWVGLGDKAGSGQGAIVNSVPWGGENYTNIGHISLAKLEIAAGIDYSLIYTMSSTPLQVVRDGWQFKRFGGGITYKQVTTNDTTVTVNDSSTAFTQKEVNVNNSAPVRMKETYTIAGFGEVLHVSPQSEVGTLSITFNGARRRVNTHNPLNFGYIASQSSVVLEASNVCLAYFGSVIGPTQLFITDTNYSITSAGNITMNIELQYTKRALTRILDTRV